MTKQNVLTRKGFVDQISMSSYLLTGFQVYLWFRPFFPTANVSPVLYKKKTISVHFAAIKILRQLRKVLQRVQKVLAKVNFLKGHGWSAMLCSYTSNKWKPALIRATVEDYRKNFTVIKITKCPEFPLDCISAFCYVSIQLSYEYSIDILQNQITKKYYRPPQFLRNYVSPRFSPNAGVSLSKLAEILNLLPPAGAV